MVKIVLTAPAPSPVAAPADPEAALALAYAPAVARGRLRALWAFDAQLAHVVRTTTEPTLGQLRLTWWHDAVLGGAPPTGQPLVAALLAADLPRPALAAMVDGWEVLLTGDATDDPAAYADGRGGGLFAAAGAVLGVREPLADAGAGWALVDLARHHSSPAMTARALAAARVRLAAAPRRWARPGRSLGVLIGLARRDLNGIEPQGSPRRVLAAAWLALTGRCG